MNVSFEQIKEYLVFERFDLQLQISSTDRCLLNKLISSLQDRCLISAGLSINLHN